MCYAPRPSAVALGFFWMHQENEFHACVDGRCDEVTEAAVDWAKAFWAARGHN